MYKPKSSEHSALMKSPSSLIASWPGSLGHHHLHELLVIDLPVTVDIGLTDHLVDLLIRKLLTQIRHDMPQLGSADEAVAIAVEDLEGLNQFLLGVSVLH